MFPFSITHLVYMHSWNESVLTLESRHRRCWWNVTRLWIRRFSVANRGGRTTWTVNCPQPPDMDGSPRDGGWSEWSEWEQCTSECGGGTGVRTRRCDNPRPNMLGRPCVGPVSAAGRCNEHACGLASAKTVAAIRRRMVAIGARNVTAVAGGTLMMSCDRFAVDAVKADSPLARFGWLRNGRPLSPTVDGCDLSKVTQRKEGSVQEF